MCSIVIYVADMSSIVMYLSDMSSIVVYLADMSSILAYLAAMCSGVSPAPFVMVAPARYLINIIDAS